MTTSSPPPSGDPSNYRMQATTTGNGFAIASLVCAILLFCVPGIGGLLGIVFGILGMRRSRDTNSLKGVAIAGLVIGILSLIFSMIFLAAGGAGYFFAKKAMAGSAPARAVARQYLVDLSAGNIDAALANTTGMTKEEVEAQSGTLKSTFGAFQDMTSTTFNIDPGGWTLGGVATFASGKQTYTIKLSGSGTNWKVTSLTFE